MKNFYEATVIKPTLFVDLEIYLNTVAGPFPCEIHLNKEILYSDMLFGPLVLKRRLPLMSEILLEIGIERTHPEALIIENINVDNYNIMPSLQHLASPNTHYVDFNDNTWQLHISGGFYNWYHRVTGQGFIA